MIKICKPFRTCTPACMTQGFSDAHKANDFASFYGDWLVAPFNCKIGVITGVQNAGDVVASGYPFLEGGCGIRMVSIEDSTISCVYWHCQDVFPVNVGDTVLQGQPVALMGNTGFVEAGGVYVPIDQRLIPPYKGTHTHISFGTQTEYMDFHTFIDYSIPIKFDLKSSIINLLAKIKSFLPK
jgi:hypothetical protein